jgi:hypothetical protein
MSQLMFSIFTTAVVRTANKSAADLSATSTISSGQSATGLSAEAAVATVDISNRPSLPNGKQHALLPRRPRMSAQRTRIGS